MGGGAGRGAAGMCLGSNQEQQSCRQRPRVTGAAQGLLRQEGPRGTDTMPSVSIRVTEVARGGDRHWKWMRGVWGGRGPGKEGQWARRASPGAEGTRQGGRGPHGAFRRSPSVGFFP